MESRQIHYNNKAYEIYGDPTDSYFRSGFSSDGWRSCGYYFERLLRKDSVCIDVGAHIGVTSVGFATIAEDGKVYAIEPSPKNFHFLRKNVEVNGLRNIWTYQCAIAKEASELTFYDTRGFRAGSFLSREEGNTAAQHHIEDEIKVATVSLDQFIKEQDIRRVDLIK